MTPFQAEQEEFSQKLDAMNEKYISKFFWKKKLKPKYKRGQLVRISKERTPFFKGYKPTFLGEIFRIEAVKTSLPIVMYTLRSLDDQEVITGNFYQNQITPVKQDKHRIETILKTQGSNSYVKWLDYPSRFNSWIPSKNIETIKHDNR